MMSLKLTIEMSSTQEWGQLISLFNLEFNGSQLLPGF